MPGAKSKPAISLCMIVKNEAGFLKTCLESVKSIVDEIIVVDTGSDDDTIKIAQSFGAKVIRHKWSRNFSEARNVSLKHATKDWILVLDADETISKQDLAKIKEFTEQGECDAYTLIQRNYFKDHKPVTFEVPCAGDKYVESKKYTGWFPSELVRLFKNKKAFEFQGIIHELVEPSIKEKKGSIGKSNIPIHHFRVDKSKAFDKAKRQTYLEMGEAQIKLTPENPKPYFEVGSIYYSDKDYDLAIELFEKSIVLIESSDKPVEHQSTYVYVYFNLGKSYLKKEMFKDATRCFSKVISIVPEAPLAYFFLGKAHASLNQLQSAARAYVKSAALNPSDEETCNNLANVYARSGKLDLAIEQYKNALKLAPKNATIHRNLGAIYLGLRKYSSAYKHFKRAVELNPKFSDLNEIVAKLEKVKDKVADVDYSFSMG